MRGPAAPAFLLVLLGGLFPALPAELPSFPQIWHDEVFLGNVAAAASEYQNLYLSPPSIELTAEIRQRAQAGGIFPASIQGLYEAIGKGQYQGFSVPAMNIRFTTYDTTRAALRAAKKANAGALLFEIARSEMSYSEQVPADGRFEPYPRWTAPSRPSLALALSDRPDEAAKKFRATLSARPNHIDALLDLGRSLRDMGDLRQAETIFMPRTHPQDTAACRQKQPYD